MTTLPEQVQRRDLIIPITVALWVAMIGLGLAGYHYASARNEPDWMPCENAIKDTLKAPSTYKRIDGPGTAQTSPQHFMISYDADNPYGVPIRGKGFCDIDPPSGRATWTELR